MSFTSLNDFLRMGTHGVYVWTAYGLTLAALRQRRLRHPLETLQRHDDARQT